MNTCCQAVVKRTGKPCLRKCKAEAGFCGYHLPKKSVPPQEEPDCCSICLCAVDKTLALDIVCGHVFHEACLNQWLAHNPKRTCPLCRTKLFDEPQKRTVEETLARWERLGWNITRVTTQFYTGTSPSWTRQIQTERSMAILSVETGNVIYI